MTTAYLGLRGMTEARTQTLLANIRDSKNGMTIQEVADAHDVHYQTARDYLVKLVEAGLIETAPEFRKVKGSTRGSIVYRIPDRSKMPKFKKSDGTFISLWALVEGVNGPNVTGAVPGNVAVRRCMRNIATMFNMAKWHGQPGGKVLSQNDLSKLRREFLDDIDTLDLFLTNLRALVSREEMWHDPKTFRDYLVNDDQNGVDLDKVDDYYNLATERFSKHNRDY